MRRTARLTAVALLGITGSCAGARLSRNRTDGCVPFGRTREILEMHVGQTEHVPQSCPTLGSVAIRTPISLHARPDGLNIAFEVSDPSFHPGGMRQEHGERDAVVVYPQGEGPGRPSFELGTSPSPGGYSVDDTVPWEAWGMSTPGGDFVLNLSLLDREASGAETEVRVRIAMRLPAPN